MNASKPSASQHETGSWSFRMAGTISRHVAALGGGAALAIAIGAGAALAQDVNEADKQGRVTLLQRLVIGAGVEKVAIDTPQAVSVVEQEDIDAIQPQTIGEIIKSVPGVNLTGSDRLLGQSFNIRGIGAPETTGDGGRIIVNVDGAQKFYEQYRMGSFFSDPELYKRVEVLRGPASSTLYGSGALGGVVNFTSKDASDFIADGDTGAVRIKGGYNSNRDGWLGSTTIAHRMGANAEFLLSGNYRVADSYVTGDGTVVAGSNFEAWSGLAKGTFNVGDEGKLRLSYQRFDSDLDGQALSQTTTADLFGSIDRHVVDDTAIVAWEDPFSDNDMLAVKVSASFSNTQNEQRDHVPGPSLVFPPVTAPTCGTGSSSVVCDSDYAYRTWQLNAQNTMEWRGAAWENFLTVGSQFSHQTRVAEAWLDDGTPLVNRFHPEGTDAKAGLFVQNEYIWDERLTVIPGMRVDWHRLSPSDALDAPDSTDTAFSPKIAAHYKFNETLAVFGSVAHTERFPTIDEVFSTSSNSDTFQPSLSLRKEKSDNFEAGFALSGYDLVTPGDGAQLKFTGFYNKVRDLIALKPSPRSPTAEGYENINRATIYGFEVEAAYDADHVFANAAYSYVIGRNDRTDAYLNTVAPHELALTLGGKLPEHGLRFGWTARIVAAPQDPALRGQPPASPFASRRFAEAFDVHDVFVSWKPEEGRLVGWEVQAGVDNIFDKQYKEFLNNDFAKGRTFKVSLAKQFGY
jgi:hemoglobin/transferrin/lactoferrin receptor protein